MREEDETERLHRQEQVSPEPVEADRDFGPLESFPDHANLALTCAVAPKPLRTIFGGAAKAIREPPGPARAHVAGWHPQQSNWSLRRRKGRESHGKRAAHRLPRNGGLGRVPWQNNASPVAPRGTLWPHHRMPRHGQGAEQPSPYRWTL